MTAGAVVPSRPDEPLLPGGIDRYLAARVAVCAPEDTVATVRESLAGRDLETLDDVAVCRGAPEARRLVGLIPVQRLFAAPADATAAEVLDPDPPVVSPGADPEHAAWKAVRHGESSLAVVDEEGRFRGLVPPSKLLGVLLAEHDEDFARLGGYLASARTALAAAEEPLLRRLWHRLPWLALGLAGAAVSAWVVGGFEGRIEADVRIAFFIPGVIYLADAVGTQTEAVVVRGLSVGAPMRRALALEALTGPALGALMAGLSLAAVWSVLGDAAVAVAVAIALFAACSVATLVAGALPWALARRGHDPAFGSGPLSTVLQDLLSLLIYLAVAVAVVGA
jgi:magnesium transporter